MLVYHVVVDFLAWKIEFKSLKRAHFYNRRGHHKSRAAFRPASFQTGVKLNPYFLFTFSPVNNNGRRHYHVASLWSAYE